MSNPSYPIAEKPRVDDLLADGKTPTVNRGFRVEKCGLIIEPTLSSPPPEISVMLMMSGGIKQVFSFDPDTLAMLSVLIQRALPIETLGSAAVRLGKL